jgi:DNA-binding NtrC family response regulator
MQPMHLLVLELDPQRRESLLALLRGAGHHAAAAPDASAAAEAIGVPGFDALLLDLNIPDLDVGALRQALSPAPAAPESLEAAERRHIALMLRHTSGNKRRAALLLGISRSTLLHKVRKYRLDPEASPD